MIAFMALLCDVQWWSQGMCCMFVGQEQHHVQKHYTATYFGEEIFG